MGTNLNPNGTKIRAFRIQRGWTQEQLAEIAGISLRTIQRAEAANHAAFETIRALAAAFETDFDQLIETQSCKEANPALPIESSTSMQRAGSVPEPIVIERQTAFARRKWATAFVAVTALAAGLTLGMLRSPRYEKPAGSPTPPVTPAIVSVSPPQMPDSPKYLQPPAESKRTEPIPTPVSHPAVQASISGQNAASPDEDLKFIESPTQISASKPLELASLYVPQQPESLDMSLPSQAPLDESPAISESFLNHRVPPILPVDSMQEKEEPGAVRQALSIATKKTGGFLSKAKSSLKRAF
jgi:transcriptional regulator with XRE-family HTH domain